MQVSYSLAPLLEDSHSLTLTVGAPEVAATGSTAATVVRSMVTATPAPNAGASVNIDHRRASKQKIRSVKIKITLVADIWMLKSKVKITTKVTIISYR